MKKCTTIPIISSLLLSNGEYDMNYISDKEVNDCIMDMFFYMLYNGMNNDQKKEEYFNEFKKKYGKLNKEQQDIVKNEYLNIIEAQKKNREKEKVKKKGMNKYE